MRHIRLILTQKGFLKLTRRTLVSYLIVATIFFGGGLIYLFNPFIKKTEAVWFDDNWGYRQTVALTNSGSAQTDYQVVITLDTASLTTDKMQADCDDLRVTDVNGRVLPYWIETGTNACDTSTTAIWVKVPSIGTTGNTLYIYYGNPSAVSKQNGSKVFEFFDDFEKYSTSTNIDGLGGWITKRVGGSGSAQVTSQNSRNHLTLSSTAQRTAVVQPVSVSNSGYAIETAVFVSTYTDDICVDLAFTDGNVTANGEVNNGYETCWWGWGNAQTNIRRWDSGSATTLNSPTVSDSQTNSTYYKLTFSWTGSTLKAFKNGSLLVSATDSTYTSRSYIHIGPWYTATTHHDWIGVRKAAATEPSVASPASEEKAPSPVAYWKFDDGTGTNANDSTTNNNDGTLTSGPTWQTEDQCISGKCIFFDGSNDYVLAADNAVFDNASSALTVTAWIKPNSYDATNWDMIATKWKDGTPNSYSWHFSLHQGKLSIFISSDGTSSGSELAVDSTVIDTNKWSFVSFTVDTSNDQVKLFRNGVQVGSTGSYTAASIPNSSAQVQIGSKDGTGNTDYTFPGFIDEPKIYNYARSAAQIQADYNARANNEGASVILGSQATPGSTLSNGLVGYWKMDEASWTQDCTTTSVTDSSGNGNNGKSCPTTTGPAGGAAGKYGNAPNLDGTDDYVEVSSNSSLNGDTGTVSMWFNADTLGVGDYLYSNNTDEFAIYLNPGSQIGIYYDSTNIMFPSFTTTGAWTHVAFVYTRGSTCYLYVNGALASSATCSSTAPSGGTVRLGGRGANTFDGKIDEARVYNRALSSNEISQLYNFAPGPVGYWKMDERSGTSANDSSGNGNTGTLTNSPTWTNGKYGAATNFAGGSDYIVSGSNIGVSGAGARTVSLWFYPTSSSGRQTLVDWGAGTDQNMYWIEWNGLSGGAQTIYVGGFNSDIYTSATLTLNTWHHIAVTYAGSTPFANTKIYYDGVPQTTVLNGSDTTLNTTNSVLYWGRDQVLNRQAFIGKIDDLKVYNYVRTQGQIIEDMNAGHPAPGSPVGTPLGWWKFDEGSQNTCSGGTNDFCNSGSQGSALDLSTSTLAQPATATSGYTKSGKFGSALLFDGIDDVTTRADNDALDIRTGSMSWSFWYKTTTATRMIVYRKSDASNVGGVLIDISDGAAGKIECQINTDVASATATITDSSYADGNWHYVACVFNKDITSIQLYVDGALKNTASTSAFSQTYDFNAGNFQGIGGAGAFGAITMDEVKVYGQALTAEQVKLDMNRGSSQVLGALSDNSSYQKQAANQEYCVPGDGTSCAAPVGRWDFEEGTSTVANDTSGNANTGTITEATYSKGKVGKSLNFDGSNDIVTVSDVASLDFGGAHTVEAWINFTDLSDYRGIVSKRSGTAVDYAYFVSISPSGKLGSYDGSTEVNGNTTLSANTWYHVAFVRSGSNVIFYVNGAADGSGSQANQAANAHNLLIGAARNDGDKDLFKGKIDQVRVFNYARSAAQVAWDYNKGAPVGHWKFDECQGTTANDSSGNSLSGTITPGSGGQTAVGTCTGSAGTLWKDGVTGKRNYSLDFDGTDDYISLGNPSALQITAAITVTGWIKTTTTSDGYVFSRFSHTGGCAPANNGYIMGITTANANAFFQASNGGTGTASVGTRALNDGNWHQLVGVFEGTNSLIYVDGKLDKSTAAGVSSIGTPSLNPNIGRSYCYNGPDSGGGFFTGQIDDVRVYNYAFTAKQVQQLYTGGALNFAPTTGAP